MDYSVKRIGSQTFVYGLGVIVTRILGILMLPVYLRLLSEADYGVVAIVSITFDVLSLVAGTKLATGIFRFYHKSPTSEGKASVLGTAFVLLTATYVAVALLSFVFADFLGGLASGGKGDYGPMMRAASISFVFQGIVLAPMAFLRLRDQAVYVVIAEVGKFALQLVLNLVFLGSLKLGVISVFYSSAIASAVTTLPLVVYLVKSLGIHFSMDAARDLFRFGVPMMVNQMATIFITFADRLVLVRVASESAVGIYNLAFQFALLTLAVGGGPYMSVWDPVRHELALRPDRDQLLSRGFRHLNLLLITCGVGLALFTGHVVMLMSPANTSFPDAAGLVPWLIAAHVLLGWASAQDLGILVTEKTRYVAYANWLAAVVSLAGFVLLIPRYAAFGAALTCLFAFATRYTFLYYFSQRLWPVRYEWAPVLKLTAGGTAAVVLDRLLVVPGFGSSFLVKLAILLGYFACLWMVALTSEERVALLSALRHPSKLRIFGRQGT